MNRRKKELKKWLIDHPLDDELVAGAAEQIGLATRTLKLYLTRKTIPRYVHAEFVRMGIPADVLPDPTRTKQGLIDENRELRRRLADYEPESVT